MSFADEENSYPTICFVEVNLDEEKVDPTMHMDDEKIWKRKMC